MSSGNDTRSGVKEVLIHDNTPSLSRFSECLVKKAVFLVKPECTLSGRSREHLLLKWLRFLLKVSLTFRCVISSCRFPWALWCLIVLIFSHTYGCRNLSTTLNFVCARAYPNQHLKVVRAWHFHVSVRASFFVENMYFQVFDSAWYVLPRVPKLLTCDMPHPGTELSKVMYANNTMVKKHEMRKYNTHEACLHPHMNPSHTLTCEKKWEHLKKTMNNAHHNKLYQKWDRWQKTSMPFGKELSTSRKSSWRASWRPNTSHAKVQRKHLQVTWS